MLLNKFKRWVLLVYDLNVILSWFVLHFLLGLMLLGCFSGTLVLTTMRISRLGFPTFFVKGMHVLINLLT